MKHNLSIASITSFISSPEISMWFRTKDVNESFTPYLHAYIGPISSSIILIEIFHVIDFAIISIYLTVHATVWKNHNIMVSHWTNTIRSHILFVPRCLSYKTRFPVDFCETPLTSRHCLLTVAITHLVLEHEIRHFTAAGGCHKTDKDEKH